MVASSSSEAEIRARYEQAGQGHVFDTIADLSVDQKASLLEQLDSIPVEKISSFLQAAQKDLESISQSGAGGTEITPFSKKVGRSSNAKDMEVATAAGIKAIERGEVAALVLAGGQGTRLGFDGPKGMYDIGLPSGRTLFQLLSERIGQLSWLAHEQEAERSPLPFYIMTSPINHEATVNYFKEHKNFGLESESVQFFQQGMLPCLTENGKIIMESASKVAMAPDGNGGIYPSMVQSGMLEDMSKRGVKYLHVFSIDNALTKPADPAFVGHCILNNADCGNKVVWKADAHEKVGVIAEKDGKPCVVEYSDITKEMAERTDEDGRLLFGAGNICNHFYTIDFIQNTIVPKLGNLYHIARKKIPYYDPKTKTTVTPTSNNGIKLESFIFDIFPLSQSMAVLDVTRSEEFAPVKNAPGSATDSPDTARTLISELAQKWVRDAGGRLSGDSSKVCEVAPSTSYCGEGLEILVKDKDIHCPFRL